MELKTPHRCLIPILKEAHNSPIFAKINSIPKTTPSSTSTGIGIGNQITIKRPVVKGNLSKGDEQLGSPLRPIETRAEESVHCLVQETIQKILAPDGTAEINSKKSHVIRRYLRRSTRFRKQLLHQDSRSPIGKGIICDRYIWGATGSANKIEKSIKIVIQGIGIGNQITIKRPVVKGNLRKGDEQLGSRSVNENSGGRICPLSHVIRRYFQRSIRFRKQLLNQHPRSPIGKGIICDGYIWGVRGSANKIEKSIKIVIQGIGIGNQITIKRPVVKGNLSKGDEQLGSPLRPMKIRAEESVHCLVRETIQKIPAPDGTAEINSKKSSLRLG
ncbi:hypothetical protein CEXT_376451 [Caerostris extrusa]|uniref:Ribosomal protein S3 n=1 Tax=Caerostris extrusa TaxID=172846 RepID=A0AAV4P2C9_CAEEX|nr:hypothetical protein CEXT_376451 [Caerostris extrusa]